ncbi:hypothetical protein Bca101_044915 [Brassica carinata]
MESGIEAPPVMPSLEIPSIASADAIVDSLPLSPSSTMSSSVLMDSTNVNFLSMSSSSTAPLMPSSPVSQALLISSTETSQGCDLSSLLMEPASSKDPESPASPGNIATFTSANSRSAQLQNTSNEDDLQSVSMDCRKRDNACSNYQGSPDD